MKNLIFVDILILISLIACHSTKNGANTIHKNSYNQPILINMPLTVKLGQTVQINISTTLDEGIILYDPMLTHIERFENNEWKQLRILHCPCGANCIAPPREQLIKKGEIWKMSWNLIESWCENVKGQDIPNTIELPAIPGEYRIVISYSLNTQERIKTTKEFQLIY